MIHLKKLVESSISTNQIISSLVEKGDRSGETIETLGELQGKIKKLKTELRELPSTDNGKEIRDSKLRRIEQIKKRIKEGDYKKENQFKKGLKVGLGTK